MYIALPIRRVGFCFACYIKRLGLIMLGYWLWLLLFRLSLYDTLVTFLSLLVCSCDMISEFHFSSFSAYSLRSSIQFLIHILLLFGEDFCKYSPSALSTARSLVHWFGFAALFISGHNMCLPHPRLFPFRFSYNSNVWYLMNARYKRPLAWLESLNWSLHSYCYCCS